MAASFEILPAKLPLWCEEIREELSGYLVSDVGSVGTASEAVYSSARRT